MQCLLSATYPAANRADRNPELLCRRFIAHPVGLDCQKRLTKPRINLRHRNFDLFAKALVQRDVSGRLVVAEGFRKARATRSGVLG